MLSTLAITNNYLNNITEEKWQTVSSACEFLEIFDKLTTEMNAENVVTISKQNLFCFLLEHLRKFVFNINMQRGIISMAAEIKTTLDKYFKNLEDHDIQSQAIFLDPRFIKYGFSSNTKFDTCKINLGRKLQQINIETSNDPVEIGPSRPTTSIGRASYSI